tara:strand:+ start:270 stop:440 length:171 start_codon:yes stop_codon:yes gene_type:complete
VIVTSDENNKIPKCFLVKGDSPNLILSVIDLSRLKTNVVIKNPNAAPEMPYIGINE